MYQLHIDELHYLAQQELGHTPSGCPDCFNPDDSSDWAPMGELSTCLRCGCICTDDGERVERLLAEVA